MLRLSVPSRPAPALRPPVNLLSDTLDELVTPTHPANLEASCRRLQAPNREVFEILEVCLSIGITQDTC